MVDVFAGWIFEALYFIQGIMVEPLMWSVALSCLPEVDSIYDHREGAAAGVRLELNFFWVSVFILLFPISPGDEVS